MVNFWDIYAGLLLVFISCATLNEVKVCKKYWQAWLLVLLVWTEAKTALEKVFTKTWTLLNLLKQGYLFIFICYNYRLCKPCRLMAPAEIGGCSSWLLGQVLMIALAWLLEIWKICISVWVFWWKKAWLSFACLKMFGKVFEIIIVNLSAFVVFFTKNFGSSEWVLMWETKYGLVLYCKII